MTTRPIHIKSLAGVKRDGTRFEGDFYIDAKWMRFQRGLPRKMAGYRQVTNDVSGLNRGMFTSSSNNLLYTQIGSANYLEQIVIDQNGNPSPVYDRTPAGFATNANNMWQFDIFYDPISLNASAIVAHAAPNLNDISSTTDRPIYIGATVSTSSFSALGGTSPNVSGGIVILHPYIVAYGNSGYVAWSAPDDPQDWTSASGGGEAYVTGQKIVHAQSSRGGADNSPSAIMWSLDSVIRMSYVGGTATFSFDTISDESSILSSQSIVEYDGIFFWCGVDRFLMYNGVVKEVPNPLNQNWFFDNLNYSQRQKVFGFKVPRWGEIWWCFPYGDATECSHAVIFNVREQTWYDTILPNAGRCNGQYAKVYRYPIMSGNESIQSLRDIGNLTGGSSYSNGTYYNVAVSNTTTPEAMGGTVNVIVANSTVSNVTVVSGGFGYNIGDNLTVTNSLIGGTGSGLNFQVTALRGYSLWRHEDGVDEIAGQLINPIQSYFETSDISLAAADDSQNKSIRVAMVEPDFVQSGDMTIQVTGRANARAPEVVSDPQTFVAQPQTPQEQVIYLKTIRRQMRFRFESNTLGGNYQMGLCLAHIEPADGTVLG
jgi:hypothetical protein